MVAWGVEGGWALVQCGCPVCRVLPLFQGGGGVERRQGRMGDIDECAGVGPYDGLRGCMYIGI